MITTKDLSYFIIRTADNKEYKQFCNIYNYSEHTFKMKVLKQSLSKKEVDNILSFLDIQINNSDVEKANNLTEYLIKIETQIFMKDDSVYKFWDTITDELSFQYHSVRISILKLIWLCDFKKYNEAYQLVCELNKKNLIDYITQNEIDFLRFFIRTITFFRDTRPKKKVIPRKPKYVKNDQMQMLLDYYLMIMYMCNGNYYCSAYYHDNAFAAANKYNNYRRLADLFTLKAELYEKLNSPKLAHKYYLQSLHFQENYSIRKKAIINSIIGKLYYEVEALITSDFLVECNDDTIMLFWLYYFQAEFSNCVIPFNNVDDLKKVLNAYPRNYFGKEKTILYSKLARNFYQENNYISAMYYYSKALVWKGRY